MTKYQGTFTGAGFTMEGEFDFPDMPPPYVPPEPTPTEPYFKVRAVWDIGAKSGPDVEKPYVTLDWPDPVNDLGITHVVLPIASNTGAKALADKGLKSLGWYIGMWNNSTKAWSWTDDKVRSAMNTVMASPAHDHRWYLTDEPIVSTQFIDAANARVALIKSIDPGAICSIADYFVAGSREQLDDWDKKTTIDECWLDTYAVRGTQANIGNPGKYESYIMTDQLNAAKANATRVKYMGVIGIHNDKYQAASPYPAYSGVNARIPAPGQNQIKDQVDGFRAWSGIKGIITFSYSPYPETGPPANWSGWLRHRADLCAEMKEQFLRP